MVTCVSQLHHLVLIAQLTYITSICWCLIFTKSTGFLFKPCWTFLHKLAFCWVRSLILDNVFVKRIAVLSHFFCLSNICSVILACIDPLLLHKRRSVFQMYFALLLICPSLSWAHRLVLVAEYPCDTVLSLRVTCH